MVENSYISFVNMDYRTDRLEHMTKELARVNLKAVRTRGMKPTEYLGSIKKVSVMLNRTPGAVGCHFSQVAIMEEALKQGKHAWVMEDDLIFCSDLHGRLAIIKEFTDTHSWDIVWLGASFHVNPPFWHPAGPSNMKPDCSAHLGKDAEKTDNPRMMRTFGAFATFAYIVNVNSIPKILGLFDQHLHTSIGIDWLMIKLQPQLFCYAFVPGCCKQMDGRSDIGNGDTIWSGFLRLNGTVENSAYVFQDLMHHFDPLTFDWAECN